jgi:hypothetical protein
MPISFWQSTINFLSSCFTLSLINSVVGFVYIFSLIRICGQALSISESAAFLVVLTSLGLIKNSDLCKVDFFYSILTRHSSSKLHVYSLSGSVRLWPRIISIVSRALRYSYSPKYRRIAAIVLVFACTISYYVLYYYSSNIILSLLSIAFIFLFYFSDSLVRVFCLAFESLLKLKLALAVQIIFKTSLLIVSAASIASNSFLFFIAASSLLLSCIIFLVFILILFSPKEPFPLPCVLEDSPPGINRSHIQLYLPILLGFINAQCDTPLALALLGPNSANHLFFAYSLSKTISVPARSLITPLRSQFSHTLHRSGPNIALDFLHANMVKSILPSIILFASSCSLVYLTPLRSFLSPPALVLILLVALSELIAGIFYPAIDCLIFAGAFHISRFLLLGPLINILMSIPLGHAFGANGIACATILSVFIVSVSAYNLGAKSLFNFGLLSQ